MTMTERLHFLAAQLAGAREHYRLADEALKERMSEPDMAALVGHRLGAKLAADEAERLVRAGIETAWAAAELEGDKLELPSGLGIRWDTELTYDMDRALHYCIEVLWQALRLDRRIFEREARKLAEDGQPLAWVSIGKKMTTTIPQDLRAKLAGEGGPTRREIEAMVRKDQYSMGRGAE